MLEKLFNGTQTNAEMIIMCTLSDLHPSDGWLNCKLEHWKHVSATLLSKYFVYMAWHLYCYCCCTFPISSICQLFMGHSIQNWQIIQKERSDTHEPRSETKHHIYY